MDWTTSSSRAILCHCGCNRLIVFLRSPFWKLESPKFVACYLRTWDGNPWYTSGVHYKHKRKVYDGNMAISLDRRDQDPDTIYPSIPE